MNEYKILSNETLGADSFKIIVQAPLVAKKYKPGQFVILRVNESGERIPLTIADGDAGRGTITLYYVAVGKTTRLLSNKKLGEFLSDVAGPLGITSPIESFGTVVCVGGGVGIAAVYPIARALKRQGNSVINIIGSKTAAQLILEKEMSKQSDRLLISTDDGSRGEKGFVTDVLKKLIEEGKKINRVLAIGPVPMMRAVSQLTRVHVIPTMVSLNPIMVDGTGMCGGCRVIIGGHTQYACVDGPEFDGHAVDFENLALRLNSYRECEALSKADPAS